MKVKDLRVWLKLLPKKADNYDLTIAEKVEDIKDGYFKVTCEYIHTLILNNKAKEATLFRKKQINKLDAILTKYNLKGNK